MKKRNRLKKKLASQRFLIPQIVTLVFVLLILAGTGLLMLPAVTQSGEGTNFLDALFTATSAVCVTGPFDLDRSRSLQPVGPRDLADAD